MKIKKLKAKYTPIWCEFTGKAWKGEVTINGKTYTIIKDTKQEIQVSVKNLIKHKQKIELHKENNGQ